MKEINVDEIKDVVEVFEEEGLCLPNSKSGIAVGILLGVGVTVLSRVIYKKGIKPAVTKIREKMVVHEQSSSEDETEVENVVDEVNEK